jgi:hypothetical protein
MPPSISYLRARVIEVRQAYPDLMLDPRTGRVRPRRAKPLSATLAERVIERQCERAERQGMRHGDQG